MDVWLKLRVMQLNVSIAIPVSSSNDQQDHCNQPCQSRMLWSKRCAIDARRQKSFIFVSECFSDQDLWEWEISKYEPTNNDAKYTVIEMTWSENLKSCRGQVTDSLSSESHFLTLSLPKTIFIGTDTHQSLRPMIIYSTSVADVQLLLIRLTTYQDIYISVIIHPTWR